MTGPGVPPVQPIAVVGYKPKTAIGMRKGWENLIVNRLRDGTVEIRLAVPVDYYNPSSAKSPPVTGSEP